MTSNRDTLFADLHSGADRFVFDERVAAVFPDMIQRSVPGYADVVAMSGLIAERYARPGTRIYDLGSALGATTFSVLRRLPGRDVTVVAVDNSPAMVFRCQRILRAEAMDARVDLLCADVCHVAIKNASLVVLNFTLQFIPPEAREALLHRIRAGLVPGGVLVLSEKTAAPEAGIEEAFTELHHAFKRARGYSDLEISRKREALEDVLIPEALDVHRERLRRAGFSHIAVWYRCFDFVSLLAWT